MSIELAEILLWGLMLIIELVIAQINAFICLSSNTLVVQVDTSQFLPGLVRGGKENPQNKLIIEENLVVIIFHCTLKNLEKLIESSFYPKRSTVKGQILFHIVR